MSKKKQRLWVLFLVILYGVVAIVGFFVVYFIKNLFFPSFKTSPVITQNQQVKQEITIPVGWKTYTSNNDNIQFSYPSTDEIKTQSYGFGVTSLTLQNSNKDTDFQVLLLPKTLAIAVGQDFDGYYAMPNNTTKTIKSPLAQDNTTEQFTKIQNRTVNGLQALDYSSIASNATPGTTPEIGTIIENGSNLVLISTDQTNKAKLEQVLKTVKSL